MKVLKIALLLVAVLLLTVSGKSFDSVDDNTEIQKQETKYDVLAHAKKDFKLPSHG